MLRKVPLDQVRLGMFVYALEGSWLRHPFWRRRFLLDKEQDLHRLRESDIPGIIIDDQRGAAPEPPSRARYVCRKLCHPRFGMPAFFPAGARWS